MQSKTLLTLIVASWGLAWSFPAPGADLGDPVSNADWSVQEPGANQPWGHILSLAVDPGAVYVGGEKGLRVLDLATRKVTAFSRDSGLPHARINCLLTDQGTVWIGTHRGLAALALGAVTPLALPGQAKSADVSSLAQVSGEVFVGTGHGLYAADPKTRDIKPVGGFEDKKIVLLKAAGRKLLVALAGGRIASYDPEAKTFETVDMEYNRLRHQVAAIGYGADKIWYATDGSGLIEYDPFAQAWASHAKGSSLDHFLSALAEDGKYLWLGTFSGLFRYNLAQDQWQPVTVPPLEDNTISCVALNGETLWIGTEEGVLLHGNLHLPYLETSRPVKYYRNEAATLPGRILGTGPFRCAVDYANASFPDIWLSQYATVSVQDAAYALKIDFSRLPDDLYRFRITAWDAHGQDNQDLFTLVKAGAPLSLKFKPARYTAGPAKVEGMYENRAMEKIVVSPGQVAAVLNQHDRTFSAQLALTSEVKEITAEASDLMGRKQTFSFPVTVAPKPELGMTSTAREFTPGVDSVSFALSSNFADGPVHWELQITTDDGVPIWRKSEDSPLPATYTWDGKDADGKLVDGATNYEYSLMIKQPDGSEVTSPAGAIRSAILVVEKQKRGLVLRLSSSFLFDLGKADIKPQFFFLFDELAKIIQEHPRSMLMVEGHTDNTPIHSLKYPSNQQLSEARALNVADRLVQKNGIDRQRITSVGYGDSKPAAGNGTKGGREKNRRVEIIILEN